MVAKKITDMKDNLEIVEQIRLPLATMFNLSLEEREVPLE